MSIKQNVTRAKTDYDEVYNAGKAEGELAILNLITMNGTREVYNRAFCAQDWSDFTFPDGMVNPKETREMFYDYRGKKMPKGIWCNRGQESITSTFGGSMFRFAYEIEEIYDINMPPISNSMDNNYGDCRALKKIEKIRVLESTTYNNPFNGCKSLTYIRFEGTIANDITFQYSPLDVESMIDIIMHLKNFIETDTEDAWTRTVYFNDDCWSRLEASGISTPNGDPSWKGYVNDALKWNI